MQQFKYEIGGKTYTQKPLCPIQFQFLLPVVREFEFKSLNPLDIIGTLGDKFSVACAFVLCDGLGRISWMSVNNSLRIEVDNEKLKEQILHVSENCGLETSIQIVEDFFFCNPIVSLLERVTGVSEKIAAEVNTMELKSSSVSSQEETLQKGTESSGDTP